MTDIDLTYISDTGDEFPLVAERIYLKDASFHEYEWEPQGVEYKYGDLLKLFTKKAKSYSCTIAFSGSRALRERNIETLHDAWEHDIMLQKPGRLVWNNYSIECYFISSKVYSNKSNTRTLNDVTIYCPFPFWIKETKYEFDSGNNDLEQNNIDLPLDFPFDLGVSGFRRIIDFNTSIPLDFRLVVHGAAENPAITINSHLYEVDTIIPNDVDLVISSIEKNDREKAVTLDFASGRSESVLYARNRESYIFEPITPNHGQITIATDQHLEFDLYLIEKRSEPKWT